MWSPSRTYLVASVAALVSALIWVLGVQGPERLLKVSPPGPPGLPPPPAPPPAVYDPGQPYRYGTTKKQGPLDSRLVATCAGNASQQGAAASSASHAGKLSWKERQLQWDVEGVESLLRGKKLGGQEQRKYLDCPLWVNDKYKLAFVRIQKTGSSALLGRLGECHDFDSDGADNAEEEEEEGNSSSRRSSSGSSSSSSGDSRSGREISSRGASESGSKVSIVRKLSKKGAKVYVINGSRTGSKRSSGGSSRDLKGQRQRRGGRDTCMRRVLDCSSRPPGWLDNYFVFSAVRSPLERLASLYRYLPARASSSRRCPPLPWTKFCSRPGAVMRYCSARPHCCRGSVAAFRPELYYSFTRQQTRCVTSADGVWAVDYLLRTESLSADFAAMVELANGRQGVPHLPAELARELPVANPSHGADVGRGRGSRGDGHSVLDEEGEEDSSASEEDGGDGGEMEGVEDREGSSCSSRLDQYFGGPDGSKCLEHARRLYADDFRLLGYNSTL